METRTISILLIVLAIVGLSLEAQGKLIPVLGTLTGPNPRDYSVNIGGFALAVVAFLFVLSFLDSRNGAILTGIVVLGALLQNHQQMGDKDVINTLFRLNPTNKQGALN